MMKTFFFCLLFFFATSLQAGLSKEELNTLRSHWAEVKYLTPKEQKGEQFEALAEEVKILLKDSPKNATLLAWQGTILSSYAAFKGGIRALTMVREAKTVLEASIALDPKAENGLAYAILGALYYRVPSRPLGFKDLEKAKQYLLKALAVDAHNIDANFFYGEYLAKIGDEEAAHQYLLEALDAPPRPLQRVADNGRREEILSVLATLKRE